MENRELLLQISEMMENQTKEIKLTIENAVTKRIDTLFDGYKLTHEKQFELERKTERLENELEQLKDRLAALENRTA